jgi:hypothetical protein
MKLISYKTFDNYISRVVNKTIKEYGKSYSNGTIETQCKAILEVRPCEKDLIVVDNWRELVNTTAIVK